MTTSKIKKECEALKTIRRRWQLRGWQFTPLERSDGVNETLESIDALRNSPVCWSNFFSVHDIEKLLDDLEYSYKYALESWTEHRIVFDCQDAQRDFLRWPKGTFSAPIQRAARSRYWELVTTTRFSVNAIPSIFNLQRVRWPSQKITIGNIIAIASMVCIIQAIQSLEKIEEYWREDSLPYRFGKSFDWLSRKDPEEIEMIISVMLETSEEGEIYNKLIQEARESLAQANKWLSFFELMNFHKIEVNQSVKAAVTKKSEQARAAATKPRKGIELTLIVLANYFNARPGEKWESLQNELTSMYGVSASTVARRHKQAKNNNLLS